MARKYFTINPERERAGYSGIFSVYLETLDDGEFKINEDVVVYFTKTSPAKPSPSPSAASSAASITATLKAISGTEATGTIEISAGAEGNYDIEIRADESSVHLTEVNIFAVIA